MSVAQPTAPQRPLPPAVAAALRALDVALQSHWTPVVLSVVAILVILMGAGGSVLHTRLGELAAGPSSAEQISGPRQSAPPATLEFTLAPEAVRAISMDEARAFNAALPFSTLPIQAARPFIMAPDRPEDYVRALDCLAAAVYYEAASETGPGQAAVAQVVINRMRHPAFPKTICGVVFQGQERTTGCQFSFTCDGAMARQPSPAGWARARAVASAALNGLVAAEVGMATHYHTDWVAPYWAERLVKMHQIGTHIFYRWTGAWGLPGAFTGAHAGAEPAIAKLGVMATPVETLDVPVIDVVDLTPLTDAPLVIARPTVEPENTDLATTEAAPVEETVVAAAPAVVAPAIQSNPMDRVTAPPSQRRSRLAVPR